MNESLKGHVYLHIGPPKTASTALQYALQSNSLAGYVYAGVTQPRGTYPSEFSRRLQEYYDCPAGSVLQLLSDEVRNVLQSGRDLVLSEEDILVDRCIPHQIKLERVARVFDGCPVTVIACVRDPVIGLQSLYQELFPQLSPLQRLSFSQFLRSNQASVFDYDHVRNAVMAVGLGDVHFVSFDMLTTGAMTYGDLLGGRYSSFGAINLTPKNIGEVSKEGRRKLGMLTLGAIIKPNRWVPQKLVDRIGRNRTISYVWPKMRNWTFWPRDWPRLVVPPSLARSLREKADRTLD